MNATASTGVVPIAEPSELILEYQRVVARLAQARIITPDEAVRRVRSMKRARALAEQRHEQLAELVFHLVLSLDDGTLKEGEHFMRLADDRLALHPEAAATALYRAQRGRLLRREVQSLLVLAAQQLPEIVPERMARVRFNREGDRRRVVVLHLPSAQKFVGERPKAVPAR